MGLPMLTNVGDIDTITNILSSKIKEISESEARKINKQAFSEDNIFTFTFLGIIQKDDKVVIETLNKWTNISFLWQEQILIGNL